MRSTAKDWARSAESNSKVQHTISKMHCASNAELCICHHFIFFLLIINGYSSFVFFLALTKRLESDWKCVAEMAADARWILLHLNCTHLLPLGSLSPDSRRSKRRFLIRLRCRQPKVCVCVCATAKTGELIYLFEPIAKYCWNKYYKRPP